MISAFPMTVAKDFSAGEEVSPKQSLFQQYEQVVVNSIITSFGLDFLVHDQYGGDVDTIHNVRKIGTDSQMNYKSQENARAYENRGEYNSTDYHRHKEYITVNREASAQRKSSGIIDEYTGKRLGYHDKTNLDHVVSAKEIHDDRGRVLAGLNGTDLANSRDNLKITNEHTNKSKKQDSMDTYLRKHGDEYTIAQRERMKNIDAKARKAYNAKLAVAYYTSSNFMKDTLSAAGNVGVRMGCRQALGLVFMEIWLSVKEELHHLPNKFEVKEVFVAVSRGIKCGFQKAKEKWRQLMSKFMEGAVAGAISSLVTTIINIFVTTAKHIARVIRQCWASLVEAGKILFFNPDNLPWGEQLRAAAKVLAVGASVIVGSLVTNALESTPIQAIPIAGSIITDFCGILVSGIVSCSLLYCLDNSKLVQKLVEFLNKLDFAGAALQYFREQAVYFEQYAARLEQIDITTFKREVTMYETAIAQLDENMDAQSMNNVLLQITKELGLKVPWKGDFDTFMSNRNNQLRFE